MLNSLFIARDIEEIVKIPLGLVTLEDKLIWHYEKSGIFFVHPTYHMGMKYVECLVGNKAATSFEVERRNGIWALI